MSGYVPKRVANTRTAMGSTDQNSSGQNMLGLVSTIGRRRTNLREIQRRSFSSFLQLDYWRNKGNTCAYWLPPIVAGKPYTLNLPTTDVTTGGYIRSDACTALGSDCSGTPYFGNINGYPQCSPTFNGFKLLAIQSSRAPFSYNQSLNDFWVYFEGYTTDNAPNLNKITISGMKHLIATGAPNGAETVTFIRGSVAGPPLNLANNQFAGTSATAFGRTTTLYKWQAEADQTTFVSQLLYKPSSLASKAVSVIFN